MSCRKERVEWTQRMRNFQWKQSEINRLIMNYLVREGYKDALQKFESQAKLATGVQLDTEEYRQHIRNAVRAGQVQYAIEMAKKLYRNFECDNYMYFHMQQLQLIELLRERDFPQNTSATNICASQTADLELSELADLCRQGSSDYSRTQSSSMEPKMMFLIRLILWAQGKLDNVIDVENDSSDLEVDVQRAALQRNYR